MYNRGVLLCQGAGSSPWAQGKKKGYPEWWGVELKLVRVEEGDERSTRPSRQRGQLVQRPCGSWAVCAGATEPCERRRKPETTG